MEYSLVKTYNFKEEILDKLELSNFNQIRDIYIKLLRPLFMPKVDKKLNLGLLYESQTPIIDKGQESYTVEQDILDKDEEIEQRKKRRNKSHIEVIQTLLEYASNHIDGFYFSEYIKYVEKNPNFGDMLEEKLIFMQMLKLYDIQIIDIDEWKNESQTNQLECNGEFDLDYCLKMIEYSNPNLFNIKNIVIKKSDKVFEYKYEDTKQENEIIKNEFKTIEITDLRFFVILNEEVK